jgi:hypothetical protein
MGLTPDQLAAWVQRSCRAQGVPVKVTDAGVAARVVALLGGPAVGGRAQARSASTHPDPARSQPPRGPHPVGVQAPGATDSGADDCVVQDGPDDGGLAVQVQSSPLLA